MYVCYNYDEEAKKVIVAIEMIERLRWTQW